ncbi:MAG: hypothetical protein H6700_07570 [Myxococcales bacterium]|nr:hypothetical protein [Myxococcales bacterium]
MVPERWERRVFCASVPVPRVRSVRVRGIARVSSVGHVDHDVPIWRVRLVVHGITPAGVGDVERGVADVRRRIILRGRGLAARGGERQRERRSDPAPPKRQRGEERL